MGHQPSLERYSKTCYFSRQVSFVSKNPLHLGMGSMSTDDCILDFDMQLIDLFKQMDMKTLTMKEKINNEYFRIKELLEQRPTRVELFTYMEDSIYQ